MTKRLTLHKLAENLIRDSQAPFTADEFVSRIQEHWHRRIAPSTLNDLREKLFDHDFLIGIDQKSYVPYSAVFQHIGSMPIVIELSKFEKDRKILLAGHRFIPFLSVELQESQIKLIDQNGEEIPKKKKSFFIDEVMPFYQYSSQRHFPDHIIVNPWVPGKSKVDLTIWDLKKYFKEINRDISDALKICLKDFDQGLFEVQPYKNKDQLQDQLKLRYFYIQLEKTLGQFCEHPKFQFASLEKQLLYLFYSFQDLDNFASAFSLISFTEFITSFTLGRGPSGEIQFLPQASESNLDSVFEVIKKKPVGRTGSLQNIFEDMGLAITENEFKAILITLLDDQGFEIKTIFDLLFGAKKDCFFNQRQSNAFYRLLRKLLHQIYEELESPESILISKIRKSVVSVKIRLIEMMRFLEVNLVNLEDLPEEIIEQLAELDTFCLEALTNLSQRDTPPEIKSIRDMRMAVHMVQPNLDRLEEDIYYRLGIY